MHSAEILIQFREIGRVAVNAIYLPDKLKGIQEIVWIVDQAKFLIPCYQEGWALFWLSCLVSIMVVNGCINENCFHWSSKLCNVHVVVMEYNDCNYRVIIIIRQKHDTHKLAPEPATTSWWQLHRWWPWDQCPGHSATCALFSQILPNIQLKSHLAVTVAKNISRKLRNWNILCWLKD